MAEAPAPTSPGEQTVAEIRADVATPDAPAKQAKPAEPAPQEPEKPAEPAPEPRRIKVKVRGREVELDEREVIEAGTDAARVRRAGFEALEEAKRLRGDADALLKRLKEDPRAALIEALGGEEAYHAHTERDVLERLQREALSPEQRARLQAETERDAAQKRLKEIETQSKTAEVNAATQAIIKHLDGEFGKAATAAGLPHTTETLRRIAGYAQKLDAMQMPIDPGKIAAMVKDDVTAEAASTIGALDGEALLNALGPATLKKIRAADVARVKGPQAAGKSAPRPPAVAPRANGREPNPHLRSSDEWHRLMDPD